VDETNAPEIFVRAGQPGIPSESGRKTTELQATQAGGSDIVKTDENTTFDGARVGAAFVRGG
jgi:hypothetical protein